MSLVEFVLLIGVATGVSLAGSLVLGAVLSAVSRRLSEARIGERDG